MSFHTFMSVWTLCCGMPIQVFCPFIKNWVIWFFSLPIFLTNFLVTFCIISLSILSPSSLVAV